MLGTLFGLVLRYDSDAADETYLRGRTDAGGRNVIEATLYFNDKYESYALSRYDDVVRALPDRQTYRSGRGATADVLFSGIDTTPGFLLWGGPAPAGSAPAPVVWGVHPSPDAGGRRVGT